MRQNKQSSRNARYLKAAILLSAVFLATALIGAPQKKKDIDGPVIGIDLGTTYSCVGIFKNGRVEIIPNEFGNRITPSYVAFNDEEKLVGEAAKNQAHINPTRSIYVVKRLIGRNFDDKEVQRDIKWVPYQVVKGKGGKPAIRTRVVGGEQKDLTPEEVSSMILVKMREVAENYLGRDVKHAVITVPAYFNDAQRQATKDAGQIAGLDVLRIINEPTAAAIAYGIDKREGEQNIIVFDLGGGTFDVSLLTLDNGVFEVAATAGDTHLGGEDFDQRLTEHFVKLFKKKHGKDIQKDPRAMQKLKGEVEKAKRDLSNIHQTKITIENLIDGIDFTESITRARFEELCRDLFEKTIKPVQQVLDDSGMKKTDIHEVVLVGGSTRIPKVQELIREFFDGKEPNRGINPDEAVAYGAAVQGGILGGETSDQTKGILLIDVTPLTLGIEVMGGQMSKIIPRGTVIPTKKSQPFTTTQDQQTQVRIAVYEGERTLTKDNHLLGEFTLTGIPPAKRGTAQIEVTFTIDENSILSVTAKERGTGRTESITITNDKSRLSKEEIDAMIKDSEKYAAQDQALKDKLDARSALDQYLYSMRSTIDDKDKLADKIDYSDKNKITDALDDALSWLRSNEDNASKEDFEERLKDVQRVCDPVIAKVYQKFGGQGKQSDDEEQNDEF